MNRGTNWRVTVLQEDALLFALGPDGTMTMRAVPRTEWEAHLAEYRVAETDRPFGEIVRGVVHAKGTGSSHRHASV